MACPICQPATEPLLSSATGGSDVPAFDEHEVRGPVELALELAVDVKVPVRLLAAAHRSLGPRGVCWGVLRAQPQSGAHRNVLFDRQARAAAGAVQDVRLLR